MTKEEAIKHLHTYSSTNGSGLTTQDQHEEAKKMAIKALETQLRWIPCSERLPDEDEIGDEDSVVIFCTKDDVFVGYYEPYFGGKWRTYKDSIVYNVYNVIAWMPLPEPWEGGQDGKD